VHLVGFITKKNYLTQFQQGCAYDVDNFDPGVLGIQRETCWVFRPQALAARSVVASTCGRGSAGNSRDNGWHSRHSLPATCWGWSLVKDSSLVQLTGQPGVRPFIWIWRNIAAAWQYAIQSPRILQFVELHCQLQPVRSGVFFKDVDFFERCDRHLDPCVVSWKYFSNKVGHSSYWQWTWVCESS